MRVYVKTVLVVVSFGDLLKCLLEVSANHARSNDFSLYLQEMCL